MFWITIIRLKLWANHPKSDFGICKIMVLQRWAQWFLSKPEMLTLVFMALWNSFFQHHWSILHKYTYIFTFKSILQSPQFGKYPTFSKIAQFQIKRMDILLCWLMWTKGSWGNGEILMFSSFHYLILLFENQNGWK